MREEYTIQDIVDFIADSVRGFLIGSCFGAFLAGLFFLAVFSTK